jgi:hypothetical protein
MRHERSPTLGAVTIIVLFSSLLPAIAMAQASAAAPQAASSATGAEYARTMGAALRAYNLHHWDDALPLYEQAHALKPNARTLRGMGGCLYEMHRFVAAAGYLTQALLDTRSPLPADQRGATADLLARASAAVGNVQLQLTPSNASLQIDNVAVEVPQSGEMQLDPGHHELTARAPGHELLIVQVEIVSGQNTVTLSLPALRAPVALAVAAPPVAAYVQPPPPAPNRRKPLKRGLIAVGSILAAGGLISAGTTGLLALKRSNELHDQCPNNGCPVSKENDLDHARKLAMVSNVMWGVAGVGAGICLLGILLPNGSDKNEATTTVQLGLTGVSLHGGF